MKTEPTLRELIDRATPGPWKANGGSVRVDAKFGDRVCAMASPAGAAPEAWGGIELRRHANAQLIARCNPQTMLAVVEALELSRHSLETAPECIKRMRAVENALALLNSQPLPTGEK